MHFRLFLRCYFYLTKFCSLLFYGRFRLCFGLCGWRSEWQAKASDRIHAKTDFNFAMRMKVFGELLLDRIRDFILLLLRQLFLVALFLFRKIFAYLSSPSARGNTASLEKLTNTTSAEMREEATKFIFSGFAVINDRLSGTQKY